jgi:hypothetical protein
VHQTALEGGPLSIRYWNPQNAGASPRQQPGSSAPENGPQSVEKGPGPLRPDLPVLAPVTKKKGESNTWNLWRSARMAPSFPSCFLPAHPPWWCGGGASGRPQPVPPARRPAPVIAGRSARAARRLRDRQDRLGRQDPACTFHPPRDRAVTGVTSVTGVTAVIAGIVLSGPVRAARTVGLGRGARSGDQKRSL